MNTCTEDTRSGPSSHEIAAIAAGKPFCSGPKYHRAVSCSAMPAPIVVASGARW
jgi:hypothetical protein